MKQQIKFAVKRQPRPPKIKEVLAEERFMEKLLLMADAAKAKIQEGVKANAT